jgi:O-antigen/teichoic acid export membrane protein
MKWVAVGKLITQTFRWLITFLVIRLLTPADYGVVAIAEFFLDFLWLFGVAGAGTAVVQARNLTQKSLGGLFTFILGLNLIFVLVLLLSAGFIGDYYGKPDVSSVIVVASLGFLIVAVGVIPSSLIAKEMDFRKLTYIDIASQISAAVSTLYMAYIGLGFWALVYGELVQLSVRAVLSNIYSPVRIRPNTQIREAKNLILFGGTVSLDSVIFHVYTHMDVAIAGLILTAAEIGEYHVAMLVAAIPLSKIMPSVKQVAMPAYSKVNNNREIVAEYCLKSQRLAMFLMFPIFYGLSSIADTLVAVVFGDRWEGAIIPLTLSCLIMPLRASEELFSPALKAIGKAGILLGNSTIILLVMFVAIISGVRYGVEGLAMAWVCGFPVAYIFISRRILKTLNIPVTEFVQIFTKPFLISAVMYGSVEAVEALLIDVSPVVVLLASIVTGAMVYMLLSWAANRETIYELIRLKH